VRFLAVSPADRAAVGVAQALGAHFELAVDVYCVAPPAAEAALLELAAAGVRRTVRLALRGDEDLAPARWLGAYPSSLVARVLAGAIGRPTFVIGGDHSLDRGSGSVPARLAQRLGYAQALGLLEIDVESLRATRRLDSGWREMVSLRAGSVLSVEAPCAQLARAGLSALRSAELETYDVDEEIARGDLLFAPYRATADVVPAPLEPVAARRAMEVIGALVPARRREVVVADAPAAADLILERLATWGYR
jgi:electron transfer flavoprotein beta subunit